MRSTPKMHISLGFGLDEIILSYYDDSNESEVNYVKKNPEVLGIKAKENAIIFPRRRNVFCIYVYICIYTLLF